MELRHLRTFRVVARTLNLTKAAAELHYAQSSVTEQIQALEAQLDTQLFDRSGRRIRLTPSGERLITYADRVLALVEEAKAAMEVDPGEPVGEIVVGALETLCIQRVPALFTSYRARWPQVRISVREGGRGELYGAVRRGEMDACLTFGAPPADPTLASEILAHLAGHGIAGHADLVAPAGEQGQPDRAADGRTGHLRGAGSLLTQGAVSP